MKTPLLTATLARAGHVCSFHIQPFASGWEASKREDQRVVQEQCHSDWHEVERTLTRFSREIAALRQQGWLDA